MWLLEQAAVPVPYGVENLLTKYPYRQFYFWYLGIDPIPVQQFHLARLTKLAEKGELFVLSKGDEIGAFFQVDESAWHSEIFGSHFFRIQDFNSAAGDEAVAQEALSAALDIATEDGAEVLSMRADSSDYQTARLLVQTGFLSVGHSLKLNLHLREYDTAFLNQFQLPEGFTIDYARSGDEDAICGLAGMTHSHSHFFNDPRMEEKSRETLFPEWTRKCLNGLAQKTLVCRAGGEIAGFATLMVNRSLSESTGHVFGILDFLAIAPTHQGRGLGKAMVAEALRALKQECSVAEIRTMNDNYRAIALYQGFGFAITGSDQIFHMWF